MKISKLIVAATLSFAATASAHSLPGNAGHAFFPSESTCFFQGTWAGILNNCAGTRSWVVPLQNTLTTTSNVTIKATGNGTCAQGGVCLDAMPKCTAFRVNAAGAFLAQTTPKTLSSIAGLTTTLGSFSNVMTTDTLHVVCELAGSDTSFARGLMSISW